MTDQAQRTKRSAIRAVATAMALLNWTEALISDLEDQRETVFRLLASRVRHFRRSFKKYFRLTEYIQWQTITGERLAQEVSEELEPTFLEAGVSGFSLLTPAASKFIPNELADAARMNIERFVKVLRSQTSNVNRAFSEFISIRNVEVSYSLQRRVLILTIIAVLVAIPSVAPTLEWVYKHWLSKAVHELVAPSRK